MFRHKNWIVMLILEGIQRRVTKIIKRAKNYSHQKRLERFGLTTYFTRKKNEKLFN